MSQETLLRARLELQLREVHAELARLEAERVRLARKNEVLAATLYELRSDGALSELSALKIEEALSFDGQPWSCVEPAEAELFDDDEESGPVPR